LELFKILETKDSLREDRAARICENAFRLVLVILAILGIFRGNSIRMHQGSLLYHSLMTLAISFIPDIIRKSAKVFIIAEFRFIFIFYVFLTQFLGEILDFFMKIVWWDVAMHVYSAFIITLVGYIIAHAAGEERSNGKKVHVAYASAFAFSFSIMFGTFWEIYEYLMDISFGLNMQKSGLVDTMEDLIVCFCSSAIVCFIYIYDVKNSKDSIVLRTIDKFLAVNKKAK
jgi:hypothetical protein